MSDAASTRAEQKPAEAPKPKQPTAKAPEETPSPTKETKEIPKEKTIQDQIETLDAGTLLKNRFLPFARLIVFPLPS